MDLKSKASELAEALKATAEFAELKQAKEAVDRNRGLRSEIEALRRKQRALFSGRLSANEAESGMAELNRNFGQLTGIPEFDRYMEVSGRFNELLNRILRQINESVESGLK